MKKVGAIILLLLISVLLLSPVISLFISDSLRDHTYGQIIMHVIALKEVGFIKDPQDIAKKLFRYTVSNTIVNPGDLIPYEDKALGYLINSYVFCDYAAEIFTNLCAQKGLNARYCMLLDENGVSFHTIAEVEINNRWLVFDPTEGNFYTNTNGQLATLEELSDNPSIAFNHKRISCFRVNGMERYNSLLASYKKMFPLVSAPKHSSSKKKKIMPPDRVGFFYYSIFKNRFLRPYQDTYLRRKTSKMDEEQRIYYIARNYHLVHRNIEAARLYNKLLTTFSGGRYFERAAFYLGLLYLEQEKDFRKALETFSLLYERGALLKNYALYYIGKCYGLLGLPEKAEDYVKSSGIFCQIDPSLAN